MKLYYLSLFVLLGWTMIAGLISHDRFYLYLFIGLLLLEPVKWIVGKLSKNTQ